MGGGKLPERTKLKQRRPVRPEYPPDNGSREHRRRALVFVLLGPLIGALAQWSIAAVLSGGPAELYVIPPAYLLSLVVCAITASLDGILASDTPVRLRASLTAAIGAAVAVGIVLLLGVLLMGGKVWMLWPLLIMASIVGAAAAGMSSLLSHNYCGARLA
jgi:hypothetical protein